MAFLPSLFSLLFCSLFFSSSLSASLPPPPPYETLYFDQYLDHFNLAISQTFKQRFLWADQYWGNGTTSTKLKTPLPSGCRGPIFFYTGNESPVTDYYANSGYWTQVMAPQYNALLVFAEHRYFGNSMPFGNQSFEPGKINFLSTHQALADYARLIGWMKDNIPGAANCPVVAFGGSYGGMLTAWFRLKYPHVVIGGLSASAPFAFIGSGVSPFAFTLATTNTFEAAAAGCSKAISQSYSYFSQLAATAAGRQKIQSIFKLCDGQINNQSQADAVSGWITAGLQGMAMLDYPYATNYGISLPGWPVNKTCNIILNATEREGEREKGGKRKVVLVDEEKEGREERGGERDDDDALLQRFANGIGVFYNNTGNVRCYNIQTNVPDWGVCCGWDYLACTDVYLPSGSSGMFPYSAWNLTDDSSTCQKRFGVSIRPNWSIDEFGGLDLGGASNIIFSNGLLDPWHTSGVLTSLSPSLTAIVIPASAHHLDLRAPNDADPIYVQQARQKENQIVGQWLEQYNQNFHKQK